MKNYYKKSSMRKTGFGLFLLLLCFSLFAKESDSIDANTYFQQSAHAFKAKSYEKCRLLALRALDIDSTFGKAYIIIGQAYIESRELCFPKEYDIKALMFCLAVDKFEQAKKVDSSLVDRVDELIRVYSRYFPSREEIWSNIRSGDTYKIGCWINEETTIRFYEDIY